MRIVVPLVIEMTDEQVSGYAREFGLPKQGGRLYTREVAEDVRAAVLNDIQYSSLGEYADVSIKN